MTTRRGAGRKTGKAVKGPVTCNVCGVDNPFGEFSCRECGLPLSESTLDLPGLASVESSNINAVGYNPVKQALYIRFNSGATYAYFDVPEHVHREFLAAESKGRFFANAVKDEYDYEKVLG